MEAIRTAIETATEKLAEHPEAAVGTDTAAVAVLEAGLQCRVDGPWDPLVTDMAKSVVGQASAPTPGWLLRAALASCDATAVAMQAAREGIELTALKVSVESESDFRGVLGVDGAAHAGPLEIRVRIELAADDVTEDQLRAIAEQAKAHSPVGDAVAREVSMSTEVVTG
jgi:uncharacterized OsmC-like protein